MASVFSMTGYATIQSAIASGQLTVELRSVNSRFLDLTLRIPDDLHSLESAIRETIGSRVKRGKMECRLSLKSETLGATSRLSPSALTTLASLQGEALKAFPEARALSVSEILSYPGVLTSDSVDAEQVSKDVLDALNRAVERLDPEERALVTLFYYEDRSVGECAAITELSEGNVKVRLHRIRKKLYVLVNDEMNGTE